MLGAMLIFFPYLSAIAQYVEERTFPVIIDQTIVDQYREGNTIRFSIEFTKIRDCRSVNVSWTARQGKHVYGITVFNSSGAPAAAKNNINPGRFVLGPFTAMLPEVALNADTIKADIFSSSSISL